MRGLVGCLRALQSAGERGAAAVEMALTAPLLIILVIGGANFGVMAYEQSDLVAAARAAAEYARVYPATTPATIPSAITSLPPGATISNISTVCSCFTSGSSPLPAGGPDAAHCPSGGSPCSTSQTTLTYVKVTAAISSFQPFLSSSNLAGNFLGLGSFLLPAHLSATTTLRAN